VPRGVPAYLAYRALAVATAAGCIVLGLVFVVAFLDRALFQVLARPLFETDHWGYYILGVAGSALFAWGGCLIATARAPAATPGVATATTAGLIVGAVLRLLAWYSGEYRPAGDQLRLEAALLAVLALGFVWLRPPRAAPPAP
jgi:hypothetical protein